MLKLVKERHGMQHRNGSAKTPYWLHCYGVATLLDSLIRQYAVDTPETKREALYVAALGHDLYEDTATSRQEIVTEFGAEIDELIYALTNEDSDQDRTRYMQKLQTASDEITLVKLADVLENTLSVFYNADLLGKAWINDFFLPIMHDTLPIVATHTFSAPWVAMGQNMQAFAAASVASLEARQQQM